MDSGLGLEIPILTTPVLSSTTLNVSMASTPSHHSVLTPSPVPQDPTRVFEKLSRKGVRIHRLGLGGNGEGRQRYEIADYLELAVSSRVHIHTHEIHT